MSDQVNDPSMDTSQASGGQGTVSQRGNKKGQSGETRANQSKDVSPEFGQQCSKPPQLTRIAEEERDDFLGKQEMYAKDLQEDNSKGPELAFTPFVDPNNLDEPHQGFNEKREPHCPLVDEKREKDVHDRHDRSLNALQKQFQDLCKDKTFKCKLEPGSHVSHAKTNSNKCAFSVILKSSDQEIRCTDLITSSNSDYCETHTYELAKMRDKILNGYCGKGSIFNILFEDVRAAPKGQPVETESSDVVKAEMQMGQQNITETELEDQACGNESKEQKEDNTFDPAFLEMLRTTFTPEEASRLLHDKLLKINYIHQLYKKNITYFLRRRQMILNFTTGDEGELPPQGKEPNLNDPEDDKLDLDDFDKEVNHQSD